MSKNKRVKTDLKDEALLKRILEKEFKARDIEVSADPKKLLVGKMYSGQPDIKNAIMVVRKGKMDGVHYGDMAVTKEADGTLVLNVDDTDMNSMKLQVFNQKVKTEYAKEFLDSNSKKLPGRKVISNWKQNGEFQEMVIAVPMSAIPKTSMPIQKQLPRAIQRPVLR